MSALIRRVNKDKGSPEEDLDVEALKDKDLPNASNEFSAASKSDSSSPPSGSGHNVVFLAKVIFRKVVALLTEDEEEEDTVEQGTIIGFLRDIVVGIVMGVFVISIMVFLDHRGVVHLESAHNFRSGAFQLMNDPETKSNLEEATNFKFLTMDEYESKRKEIDGAAEKMKSSEDQIEKRTKELEEKKKDADAMRGEHTTLMSNELLALNKYCGGCSWSGKTTCDARIAFLQTKYDTRPIAAKVSAMGHPSCRKN